MNLGEAIFVTLNVFNCIISWNFDGKEYVWYHIVDCGKFSRFFLYLFVQNPDMNPKWVYSM